MGVRPLGRLYELVDDVRRGGPVRISHAEINDIFAARPSSRLQLIDNIEDVRRQALDSVKFVHVGV